MSKNLRVFHEYNGGFVHGLPVESGFYWFRKRGKVDPCYVLLESDAHLLPRGMRRLPGVRTLDGWTNPDCGNGAYPGRFSLEDPFVISAEYAPASPPGGWP